jgi:hypothetical protein
MSAPTGSEAVSGYQIDWLDSFVLQGTLIAARM